MEERGSSHAAEWYFCDRRLPKSQITYFCQIIIIYIIIITSIVNLSINNGDKTLFSTLLASCLGYLLPNPSIKAVKLQNTIDQVV